MISHSMLRPGTSPIGQMLLACLVTCLLVLHAAAAPIAITEYSTRARRFSGADYIELHNYSATESVNLAGYKFTIGSNSYDLPGVTVGPGQYLVLVAPIPDEDAVANFLARWAKYVGVAAPGGFAAEIVKPFASGSSDNFLPHQREQTMILQDADAKEQFSVTYPRNSGRDAALQLQAIDPTRTAYTEAADFGKSSPAASNIGNSNNEDGSGTVQGTPGFGAPAVARDAAAQTAGTAVPDVDTAHSLIE